MKLLLIDNHDSFVYNILGLLQTCGVSRDSVDLMRPEENTARTSDIYSGVILSPGPGLPSELPGLGRNDKSATKKNALPRGYEH